MLYLIAQGHGAQKRSFKIMEAVRKGKVKKGRFRGRLEEEMREHGVPDWYIGSLARRSATSSPRPTRWPT